MARIARTVTPENRIDRWKKLWGTPHKLPTEETEAAFEEFQESFVPGHMHKKFLQFFGTPKAKFGNRFFLDECAYFDWKIDFKALGIRDEHVDATIIYGSPEAMEGHTMRGQSRRSLRDLVVDDWHAACAIIRSESAVVYLFIEPKMRGCVLRIITP